MSTTISSSQPIDLAVDIIALPGGPEGWEAVIPEWTVTGMGSTEADAVHDAVDSLVGYLALSLGKDGLSVEAARRPISRSWHMRLRARLLLGKVEHVVRHRASPSRSRVSIPPPAAAASC